MLGWLLLELLASVSRETFIKHVKCFLKIVLKEIILTFDAFRVIKAQRCVARLLAVSCWDIIVLSVH